VSSGLLGLRSSLRRNALSSRQKSPGVDRIFQMSLSFIKRHRAAAQIALSLLSTSAFAEACAPGPRCEQIGGRVQKYVAQPGGSAAAVSSSAMKAYCINMVAADASGACASEFSAQGRGSCGDLAIQQRNEFLRTAKTAQSTSENSSGDSNWKERCGW
jgi:hypothetical protein